MLSAVEIVELEKKVFRYRLKQRLHYLFLGLLCVSFVLAGYLAYPYFLSSEQPSKQITENTNLLSDKNISAIISPEINNTVFSTPSSHTDEPNTDNTLLLQLPTVVNKNISEKKAPYLPEPVEKKSNLGIQEEELDNKILLRKTQNINEENFYRSKEDKIDTALLPPPLLEEPKEKGIIKIETHEVNSIQYLKEKFEKTHSIVFALMLAEEYYHTKNYNESNKWALIANNVDSENEKSWIWFAKSKLKLGHKEDAIVALKAYLKNNKSKAAQSLLNQITLGEVID